MEPLVLLYERNIEQWIIKYKERKINREEYVRAINKMGQTIIDSIRDSKLGLKIYLFLREGKILEEIKWKYGIVEDILDLIPPSRKF